MWNIKQEMSYILQPWMASLFKQRGMYVCMKRYHCPHFADVIIPIFRCRASRRRWVRNSPKGSCRFLTASLSPIKRWISGREMSAFIAALRALIACSTMFKNGLHGGSFRNSVLTAGTGGLLCAGAPSYMKITSSSGSRLRRVCVRKSAKRSRFIPPRKAVWKTKPPFADTAKQTVMFRPRCPQTCRYALSPTLALPWLRVVQTLYPHSSINTQFRRMAWFMNQSAYSLRFTITSGRFLSFGTTRTSLSVNNIYHSVFMQLYFHVFRAFVGDVVVIFDLSVQALGHSCRW